MTTHKNRIKIELVFSILICLSLNCRRSENGVSALPNATLSYSQWVWKNPLPQGNDLSGVGIIDANTMVAVGDAGTVMKTNDGGTNWTLIPNAGGMSDRLYSVSFGDGLHGIAVGELGVIIRSTDGGNSWRQ